MAHVEITVVDALGRRAVVHELNDPDEAQALREISEEDFTKAAQSLVKKGAKRASKSSSDQESFEGQGPRGETNDPAKGEEGEQSPGAQEPDRPSSTTAPAVGNMAGQSNPEGRNVGDFGGGQPDPAKVETPEQDKDETPRRAASPEAEAQEVNERQRKEAKAKK